MDVCLERKLTQGAELAHFRHTYPLAPPSLLLLLATVLLCTITIVFGMAVALLNCWHLGYLSVVAVDLISVLIESTTVEP